MLNKKIKICIVIVLISSVKIFATFDDAKFNTLNLKDKIDYCYQRFLKGKDVKHKNGIAHPQHPAYLSESSKCCNGYKQEVAKDSQAFEKTGLPVDKIARIKAACQI